MISFSRKLASLSKERIAFLHKRFFALVTRLINECKTINMVNHVEILFSLVNPSTLKIFSLLRLRRRRRAKVKSIKGSRELLSIIFLRRIVEPIHWPLELACKKGKTKLSFLNPGRVKSRGETGGDPSKLANYPATRGGTKHRIQFGRQTRGWWGQKRLFSSLPPLFQNLLLALIL